MHASLTIKRTDTHRQVNTSSTHGAQREAADEGVGGCACRQFGPSQPPPARPARAWGPRWGLAPQPLSGGWYPAGAQSKNRPNARAEAMQCVWVAMLGVGRGSVAHGGLERAAWRHFDPGGPNTPILCSVLWGTRSVRAPRRPFEKVGVRLGMPMARSTRSWGASNTNSSRRADPFSRPSRRFARSKRREGPERIGHVGPTRGLTRAELHVASTHTHTTPSSAG